MDSSDLARLDLNLLTALHALLSERHVTRAARKIGTSQPAMSRSLARLRHMFGDPLLVRVGGQMRATARAEGLFPELQRLLAGIAVLVEPAGFDPASAEGTIRLALPDIAVLMLLPGLLSRLRQRAPQLDVQVVAWRHLFEEQLASGEIDLTIGRPGEHPGMHARTLIRNDWCCVLRRGHPLLKRRWCVEAFAAGEHMLVDLSGHGGGQVDAELARLGLRRRVVLRQPYATLSPLLVADSDLLLTTARWLARRLDIGRSLVIRPPPLAMPAVELALVWHERTHHAPKHIWLRSLLFEVAAALPEGEMRWPGRVRLARRQQ